MMSADPSQAETSEIALPPELLAALKPKSGPPPDLHIEGWKPSLFERAAAFFVSKRR